MTSSESSLLWLPSVTRQTDTGYAGLPDGRAIRNGRHMSELAKESRTPQDQISDEILAVHQDSYGLGAENVEAHLLENMVVVTIEGLEFSKGEMTLIEAGEGQSVLNLRAAFQRSIEPTFRAIIERATGRRVRTFLSNTDLDDAISVEFFLLHPAPA